MNHSSPSVENFVDFTVWPIPSITIHYHSIPIFWCSHFHCSNHHFLSRPWPGPRGCGARDSPNAPRRWWWFSGCWHPPVVMNWSPNKGYIYIYISMNYRNLKYIPINLIIRDSWTTNIQIDYRYLGSNMFTTKFWECPTRGPGTWSPGNHIDVWNTITHYLWGWLLFLVIYHIYIYGKMIMAKIYAKLISPNRWMM